MPDGRYCCAVGHALDDPSDDCDICLGVLAEERLTTFNRDDALTSTELLKKLRQPDA